MSLTFEGINQILGVDDSYKAPNKLMELLFDKQDREKMFMEFLEHEKDMSFDWFHVYFQEEHAQRKTKKQDFTPSSISKILSRIIDVEANKKTGTRLDVAAGTGGLTISRWNDDRLNHTPFEYKPSMYLYQCEELSDRALPFLLFNLMIRGMNAVVIHGDALHGEVYQVYFIQNSNDDYMRFSSLNIMPQNELVEKEFDIRKWLEEPVSYIEDMEIPDHLKGMISDE